MYRKSAGRSRKGGRQWRTVEQCAEQCALYNSTVEEEKENKKDIGFGRRESWERGQVGPLSIRGGGGALGKELKESRRAYLAKMGFRQFRPLSQHGNWNWKEPHNCLVRRHVRGRPAIRYQSSRTSKSRYGYGSSLLRDNLRG